MLGASANGGISGAVRRVADHAGSIVRLELQLAALEMKKKAVALGVGIGLAVGAALFALLALGFVFAAIAAAFATFLATWLALLVVTGILLLFAGVCALLAVNRLKKGTPPVPDHALREAKLTTEAIRR